jgi:aryl carrier-like protein
VLAEVMGRPVTTDDNLYALGADSLRMMRILARLRGRLGLDLPVGEILYRADVAHLLALAAHLPERAVSEARDEAFLAAFRRELYDDADPAA